ncbi:hypothetical protein DAEQUDRAFT_606743 [Daedalea quercina L-15889]|uniref:Uncharacterized protein n=1 Tax=Daedalea quercina L-15889 TaxID=1314783 RepID=A0A165LJ05_9APHY|nr:hypothetical protein DAEQUDRAFT_606743 [Daedalea quercina L-15889]
MLSATPELEGHAESSSIEEDRASPQDAGSMDDSVDAGTISALVPVIFCKESGTRCPFDGDGDGDGDGELSSSQRLENTGGRPKSIPTGNVTPFSSLFGARSHTHIGVGGTDEGGSLLGHFPRVAEKYLPRTGELPVLVDELTTSTGVGSALAHMLVCKPRAWLISGRSSASRKEKGFDSEEFTLSDGLTTAIDGTLCDWTEVSGEAPG